jgi:aminomethyltransferase
LKHTPLHAVHLRLGARMVDFAGFRLPVQYTSILEEHAAVRGAAGLFDVSHMGQLALAGPRAVEAASRLLSRPLADLAVGRVRYALLCNERGGVVDDVTAYRIAGDEVMLCVNAANRDKDRAWVGERAGSLVSVRDDSDATALIALQGPRSGEVLARVAPAEVTGLRRFAFARLPVAGAAALVSRTGYTGADGFEIYCDAAAAARVFEALLEAGRPSGLLPAGLGARDTLRLEAALPLYGHELDEETSPLEAGLAAFVDLQGDFIGARAIRARRDAGHSRQLVGFVLEDRGVARQGYAVRHAGRTVGAVTSGAPSPTLGKSIGLAYVLPALAATGTALEIDVRGRAASAVVVETPFVRGERAGRRSARRSA